MIMNHHCCNKKEKRVKTSIPRLTRLSQPLFTEKPFYSIILNLRMFPTIVGFSYNWESILTSQNVNSVSTRICVQPPDIQHYNNGSTVENNNGSSESLLKSHLTHLQRRLELRKAVVFYNYSQKQDKNFGPARSSGLSK